MAETGDGRRFGLTDTDPLRVAASAYSRIGQEIVFSLGAGRRGRVAVGALGNQLEMELMRERLRCEYTATQQNRQD